MITKINHIGIAVKNLDESLHLYRDLLGLPVIKIEEVPEMKVRLAMIRLGEVNIELLEATATDSPIAAFIGKRGEGVHHLALNTDNIRAELERLEASGVELINAAPIRRGDEYEIAFLHPRSTRRVLIELCQSLDS